MSPVLVGLSTRPSDESARDSEVDDRRPLPHNPRVLVPELATRVRSGARYAICAGLVLTMGVLALGAASEWYLCANVWRVPFFPFYTLMGAPVFTGVMSVLGVRTARRMRGDLPNAPAADVAETLQALQGRGNPAARDIASRLTREWGLRGTEVAPPSEPAGGGSELTPSSPVSRP